jgi:UDP-N-acetylmuramyl tripeptide synthase
MFHDLRVSPASPRPVAILNADDARGRLFVRGLAPGVRSITYGLSRGMATSTAGGWASDVVHDDAGTSFTVHGLAARPLRCRSPLHADFNVAKVLAALACVVALGGSPRQAVAQARRLVPPAGRFTVVAQGAMAAPPSSSTTPTRRRVSAPR